MKEKNIRHCGACGKPFKSSKELADHLKKCSLAKTGKVLWDKGLEKVIKKYTKE